MKLNNTVIGTVSPLLATPQPPPGDARTAGLKALAEYLSELTFWKSGPAGAAPVGFKIPLANILIEQADNETELVLPSLCFEPTGDFQVDNLGFYDEDSKDVFGRDTVLYVNGEHIETINIRVIAQFRADRRAILGGLAQALSPVEEIYGMTLVCDNYYNQTVSICPVSGSVVDGDGSANNRREGTFAFDFRINLVQLTNYRNILPLTRTEVGNDPLK